MTAIAEQFAKGGLHPRDAELDIAIARYINSGGTILGVWARAEAAAARLSGMGQTGNAVGSQGSLAQARQPVEDDEANIRLPNGLRVDASPSSSNRDERGRSEDAIDGYLTVASSRRVQDRGRECLTSGTTKPCIPVREPTPQQRLISARNARVVAITIMDTLKIDGRPIGDWTVAEARRAGHAKTREGHILIAASRMVANAAGDELLRTVVKPAEMQKIVQKAAEVADAV